MSKQSLKTHITISVDEDTIESIRELADRDERPLSQYINRILKRHLAAVRNKRKQADADF